MKRYVIKAAGCNDTAELRTTKDDSQIPPGQKDAEVVYAFLKQLSINTYQQVSELITEDPPLDHFGRVKR